ncbi:hypothetical protein ACFTZM_36030, partial [Streptomyces hydrogenans]|uniref:hypothetical protein n=1 Tax=Streptomyces hydrogenans TaxID=1873719 RepID=UPI00364156CD
MTRAADPFVVVVSGPGGVGKSALVRRLAPMLREDGFTVEIAHSHGCVLCRRHAPAPGPEDPGNPRA